MKPFGLPSLLHLRGLLELVCLVVFASAAAAQGAPQGRSVKILTDVPDAIAPAAIPSMSTAKLASLNAGMKTDNAAGLSLDLIPSGEIIAGSKIGFRITTKKPGYLILLDVDAAGKLTQIFPETATETGAIRDTPSMVKPGKPLIIPPIGSPYANFEFIAQPPAGVGMFVALLCDKPVQVVDLPNAPPPAFAPGDTLKYVRDQTQALVIPLQNANRLDRPSWSFDGKIYLIK